MLSITLFFARAVDASVFNTKFTSGEMPPPEEEVTGRKRTSPRESDKVVSLSVRRSSGVDWFLPGLSLAALKGVAYSLNLDILAE